MWSLPFLGKREEQQQFQDFLMAHADALIAGTLDCDVLAQQFESVDLTQINDLLALAERIAQSFGDVAPSEQFVARLRHELLVSELFDDPSLIERFRRMTPRNQLEVAAGIGGVTLTAGVVVLLASRPLLDMIEAWRDRRDAA